MSSADDAMKTMIRNLEEKTGKSVDAWIAIANTNKGRKHSDVVKYLKGEHGLTHGYANLVAHSSLQSAAVHADGDALIDAQYAGAKEAMRPIYDDLIKKIGRFGDDIEIAPKKAYVSVRR